MNSRTKTKESGGNDQSIWNKVKLGVSNASKSISKTPAQDRLSRIRNKLTDEQKKLQTNNLNLIKSIPNKSVSLAKTNTVPKGATQQIANNKKDKTNTSSSSLAPKIPPSHGLHDNSGAALSKRLIPPSEVSNQLRTLETKSQQASTTTNSSLKTNKKKKKRRSKSFQEPTPTSSVKECDKELPRLADTKTKVSQDHSSTTLIKCTLKQLPEPAIPVLKVIRKRRSDPAENDIAGKIVKTIPEVKIQKNQVNPLKKPSANDRLQRLRNALQKQSNKVTPQGFPLRPPEHLANNKQSTVPCSVIRPSVSKSNLLTNLPTGGKSIPAGAPEPMDIDEDYYPTIVTDSKPEISSSSSTIVSKPAETPSTSSTIASSIASFFQTLQKEFVSAFSPHRDIKENFQRAINKAQPLKDKSPSNLIYMVPDTNIFIHHLTFVKDIVEQTAKTSIPCRIYLPYIVIEELDRLKEQKDKSVSTLAMRAVKYLNEKLEKQDPSILGQSVSESMHKRIPVKYPDDSILNCCLQLKEKGLRLILLSNDINLRNKALVNNVKAFASIDVEVDNLNKFL